MFFVLLCELGSPVKSRDKTDGNVQFATNLLFPRAPSTRILVDDGCKYDLTLLYAFLDPKITFYVFIGFTLVGLYKVLEDFSVWICEDHLRRLRGSCRITTRVLQKIRSV